MSGRPSFRTWVPQSRLEPARSLDPKQDGDKIGKQMRGGRRFGRKKKKTPVVNASPTRKSFSSAGKIVSACPFISSRKNESKRGGRDAHAGGAREEDFRRTKGLWSRKKPAQDQEGMVLMGKGAEDPEKLLLPPQERDCAQGAWKSWPSWAFQGCSLLDGTRGGEKRISEHRVLFLGERYSMSGERRDDA